MEEQRKVFPLELTTMTQQLQRLIMDNPELPIVILAGTDASDGDHGWTYCSSVSFGIQEILDAEVPYMECVETDRDNFEEQIEEWLWDELTWNEDTKTYNKEPKITDEEFEIRLEEEKAKFAPYWKKVISISVDN